MANSIFYNLASGRRFPVSMLALETYAIGASEASNEDEHFDVFVHVLTGICGVEKPTAEDIEYFVTRIQELYKSKSGDTEEAPAGGKTFGTFYREYLSKLGYDSIILRMTGYDLEAARKIYCQLDREDALKLVSDYLQGLMEEGRLQMEASLYGFGGSYKDDQGATSSAGSIPTVTHDLTTEDGKAALRALGFGLA